jgi:hypothetical protein
MAQQNPPTRQLAATAHQLGLVRKACNAFLGRGLADLLAEAGAVDRFAADLSETDRANLADPQNHDWSLLYRGSVLDD